MASGLLSFDERYRWQTQILGTVSDETQTWRWAWANEASDIPDDLFACCRAVKVYGVQHGIPELTTPQLPLDQIDGRTLALIASGICEANAHYRCPYKGGALFVLIMDDDFPKCTDPPLQRIAKVFPQAIASLDIQDHKLALTGYLDHYGLSHEHDGDKIVAKENGEVALTATFDKDNRLTNLEVKLKSDETSTGETWDQGQLRRMLGR